MIWIRITTGLMAYDRETEFFAEYIAANGEWVMSSISFMQFRHDYPYRAVSREEAAETAGGILPETLFRQYLDILRDNRGEKYNRKSIKTAGRKCPAVLDFRSAHGLIQSFSARKTRAAFVGVKYREEPGKRGTTPPARGATPPVMGTRHL